MFKEYYPISEHPGEKLIILQDDKTDKFAVLKSIKPERVKLLKKINTKAQGLPEIYEYGDDYIVEEEIEGITLADKLSNEHITFEELKKIICDLCDIVAVFHNSKICHMDITPGNIIYTDEQVYLIDYSEAVQFGYEMKKSPRGTLMFCSPEHFGFAKVYSGSDIFSLGRLLKYLLERDFSAEDYAEFEPLITNACELSQKERIGNINEFLKRFENVCLKHTNLIERYDTMSTSEIYMLPSTQSLMDNLEKIDDLTDFLKKNKSSFIDTSVEKYFNNVMKNKGIKKADIVKKSGIERTYAYQLLNGTKKPSRDKMLQLCIGAGLKLDEIQIALNANGFMPLYIKHKRDCILIYAINSGKSIYDVDELLYRFGEEILSKE